MASTGQLLDLLEALSRRDWDGISKVGKIIAESERKKKHYDAANRILEALEIATSHSAFEQIGTLSAPTTQVITQTPDFVEEILLEHLPQPVLGKAISREVSEFINEWGHEARLRDQGLSPRHTLLLFGPPGCGKTLLAKHIAHSLKMRMFVVRFDTLISSFLGETGGNIRKVFDFLSANRCVLLLDELDAIAKLRDDKNELGELKRVVISLLQNLDLSSTQSLLIAATNHPHMLDPALWRRFQTTWELREPTDDERIKIFSVAYGQVISPDIQDIFASASVGMTGSDLAELALATKRKVLIDPNTSVQEGTLLALLEFLKQKQYSANDNPGPTERLILIALALRKLEAHRYSFNNLEHLSGIPHSTLHIRATTKGESA